MASAVVSTKVKEKVVTEEVTSIILELSFEEAVLIKKLVGGVKAKTHYNRSLIEGVYSALDNKVLTPIDSAFEGYAPGLVDLTNIVNESRLRG